MKGESESGGRGNRSPEFMFGGNDMAKRIIPPCAKCPYKLGQVTTPAKPCPACKLNGYEAYEQMKNLAKTKSKRSE